MGEAPTMHENLRIIIIPVPVKSSGERFWFLWQPSKTLSGDMNCAKYIVFYLSIAYLDCAALADCAWYSEAVDITVHSTAFSSAPPAPHSGSVSDTTIDNSTH